MKTISILAIIIVGLAAVVLFMRDKDARAQLAAASKQSETCSNEVARINTVMMMHSATNSELKEQITKQVERFAGLSNRVARTSEELRLAQQEHQSVRASLDKESRKAADAEIRSGELQTELKGLRSMLEQRDAEISRLRADLQQAQTDRADFQARLQRSEADVVRLQLDQTDEAALRAQLAKLKRQYPPTGFAKVPDQALRPPAKGAENLVARTDSAATGYYLQIQPDGSLKLIPPMESAGSAR